jgi:hypothetical protein
MPIAFVAVSPAAAPPEGAALRRESEEIVEEAIMDAEIVDEPCWAAPEGAPPPEAAPFVKKPTPKKRRWLLAAGIAGGGLFAMVLLCGGIGAWVSGQGSGNPGGGAGDPKESSSYSGAGPDASTYTPPPVDTSYADPYASSSSSYTAPATHEYTQAPSISTDYYAPAPAAYDPGAAAAENLWSFDRASELRAAIAQDQARLKELDALIFGAGAGSWIGDIAAGNEKSKLDQYLGPLVRQGADTAKSRLQTQRNEVQIRLDANLAELARLERGY